MGFINFLTVHKKWNIKRNYIVIDIGSGNDPILRANLLFEKYIFSDRERYSGLIIDRPTVCASEDKLPFRDKSIDFVHCSHVLEHIPKPDIFLAELQRIGKRGIIITPNGDYEKFDPRNQHLWYIWNKDNKLILKQKITWNEYHDIAKYYYKITASKGYSKFYGKNYDLFNTIYLWQNEINYSIEKDTEFDYNQFNKAFTEKNSQSELKLKTPFKFQIKYIVGKMIRPFICSNFNIDKILICPNCNNENVQYDSNKRNIVCKDCDTKYPIVDKIVFMDKKLLKGDGFDLKI